MESFLTNRDRLRYPNQEVNFAHFADEVQRAVQNIEALNEYGDAVYAPLAPGAAQALTSTTRALEWILSTTRSCTSTPQLPPQLIPEEKVSATSSLTPVTIAMTSLLIYTMV